MDVQARILETAKKLFIENGYQATSIRQIAAKSEVNVSMINYYYRSKLNLFQLIYDNALEEFINKISSILRSDLSFFVLIESWIDSFYEILIKYPQTSIFLLNEINKRHEHLISKVSKKELHNMYTLFAKRVEQEVSKGSIKNISPISIIMSVLSLSLFPFTLSKVVSAIENTSTEKRTLLMLEHKRNVIGLIICGLRKEENSVIK